MASGVRVSVPRRARVRLRVYAAGFFVCKLKKLQNGVKKDAEAQEGEEDEGEGEEPAADGAATNGGAGGRKGKGGKAPSGAVIIPVSKPKVRRTVLCVVIVY